MNRILLLVAALAALVLVLSPAPEPSAPEPSGPGPRDYVEARTLASWIVTGERHVHLIDLRPEARFLETGIRTSESVPADSIDLAIFRSIPSGHFVVLYGENDDVPDAVFGKVKAVHEQTYILGGGYSAWKQSVLEAGPEPTGSDEDAWDAYRTRVALVRYLTGQTDAAPRQPQRVVQPVARPRIKVKNEGC